MRIAITGSTGLIGSRLVERFRERGDTVHRLVRRASDAGPGDIVWSVADGQIDAAGLEGVDAVIHLAGEPIGAKRWTHEQKQRIVNSRRDGTQLLATALAGLSSPPSVMVSGSAVGYYGDRKDEVLTEFSAPGTDFLADVCAQWEQAAEPAARAGIRVVNSRTGVVIHREGALIEKIELPFKLGVGGRVGSGRQYVAWVSMEDEISAIEFLVDGDLEGPVNVVGPTPVTNAEMTKVLGRVMNRPTLLPIPSFAIRALYGEMGVTLATSSQRAVPTKLTDAGFEFTDTSIDSAIEKALA